MDSETTNPDANRFAPLKKSRELGPLQRAARSGDVDALRALLAEGQDVNDPGEDGDRALHWAVAWGQETAIAFLLDNGADAKIRDDEDNTPLHLISKKGHTSAHAFLRVLSLAKERINDPNRNGSMPLHAAAMRGRADFVTFLLSAGADPSLKDGKGMTALDIARRKGRVSVIEALAASPA